MKFLKNLFGKKSEPLPKKTTEAKPTVKQKKTEKELLTERGLPYVAIVSMDIDPENIHQGSFELDWNDKFIANLVRAGYQMKPDEPENIIVDRWFQNICRHVVLETWEQDQAMNTQRFTKTVNLGGGFTEVS